MIPVSMGDENVLDLIGIKPELAESADNQFFGVVRKDRVDQDDSISGRERPGGVQLPADEVQVVENTRRLGEPCLTRRYAARIGQEAREAIGVVGGVSGRCKAESRQSADKLEPRG